MSITIVLRPSDLTGILYAPDAERIEASGRTLQAFRDALAHRTADVADYEKSATVPTLTSLTSVIHHLVEQRRKGKYDDDVQSVLGDAVTVLTRLLGAKAEVGQHFIKSTKCLNALLTSAQRTLLDEHDLFHADARIALANMLLCLFEMGVVLADNKAAAFGEKIDALLQQAGNYGAHRRRAAPLAAPTDRLGRCDAHHIRTLWLCLCAREARRTAEPPDLAAAAPRQAERGLRRRDHAPRGRLRAARGRDHLLLDAHARAEPHLAAPPAQCIQRPVRP